MKVRRPFRALVYAAVIAAAAGYVVFSASRQPAWTNGTVIGSAAAGLFGKARPTGRHFPQWCAAPTPNGWVVRDFGTLTEAELTDPAQGVVLVKHFFWRSRWGVWHPLVETQHDETRFQGMAGMQPFTDMAARKLILEAINANKEPVFLASVKLDFYAAGGGSSRRILWLGVLGDISILAAFAAIIFSLVKLRREVRWRRPGCCAKCDYDLAGLTTGKCPECGAAVTPADSPKGA